MWVSREKWGSVNTNVLPTLMPVSLNDLSGTKGIHFVHTNMRSLKGNYATFLLAFTNLNIDVITVSETWLKENDALTSYQLHGYSQYRTDRVVLNRKKKVKKAGGVCMFIRDDINHDPNSLEHLCISERHIEMQMVILCKPHMKPVLCINIYRPVDGDVTTFITRLTETLGNVPELHKYEIVIMGDMNIDVRGSSDDKDALYTALRPYKLTQLITDITRFATKPNAKDSTLDLIFTNIDCVSNKGVLNNHLSDHLPVYMTRKKIKEKVEKIEVRGRSYLKLNDMLLKQGLDNYDWSKFNDANCVITCWEEYERAITLTLDKYCPVKTFSVPKYDDPWMTKEMYEIMRDKNSKLATSRRTKTLADKKIASKARNSSNRINDRARRSYIKDTLAENKDNHKRFWRIINSILPGQSNRKKEIRLVDEDTGNQVPTNQTANFINEYFINIGPKLATDMYIPWKFYDPISQNEIDEFVTNLQETKKLIHSINVNKSSALDNLPSKVLKTAFTHTPEMLVKMFNLSFSSGLNSRGSPSFSI